MKKKGWIIGLSFLVVLFAVTATVIVIDQLLNFYGRNRQFYTVDLPAEDKRYRTALESDVESTEDGTIKDSLSQKESTTGEDKPSPKKEPQKESKSKGENLTLKKRDLGEKKGHPQSDATKNNLSKVSGKDALKSPGADDKFNSWGEYISAEERSYRTMVVKKLKVKTVVIDHLSPGNGVSQEFFKVAYRSKMIPSRILEELVESREFRELIPAKYLKRERALLDIRKGLYIKLEKSSLEALLDTWSRGELTPIQKAWAVGAEE